NVFVAAHDAILPIIVEDLKMAYPNLADNTETNNSAIARVFELINYNLLCFSNLTDNFCVQPPTPTAVKFHHNMFVRLNNLIDGATRPDNAEPLEAQHITNARRAFKVYPVRYYDVRNHYCRRWIELYLQGL